MTTRDLLEELEASLANGAPLQPAAADLILRGLRQHRAGVPLEKALGIRQRGGVSLRRSRALRDRNAMLRQVASSHPEWSGLESSIVARKMWRDFEQYETRRWPRDRRSAEVPAEEPAATFFRILQNDWQMPQVDQLRKILGREFQSHI